MNYKKIYSDLVAKAKVRGLDKSQHAGYFEIHHIVPKCLGGDDSKENLVMFTGREHYVAHMLLWKAHPEHNKLVYAATMMSSRALCRVNSRLYESLRTELSKLVSERKFGKIVRDLSGQKFNKLQVVKFFDWKVGSTGSRAAMWECLCDCGKTAYVISSSLTTGNTKSCGCLVSESGKARSGENNHMYGKKHSPETIQKLKDAVRPRGEAHWGFGLKFSNERKLKMSEALRGIPWTDARRAAAVFPTGEAHHFFGKSHSKETRQKISQILKDRDQRPWENLSTQTEESMQKWAMCDYYYELWVSFNKPGLKVFTKIYNQTHNDDVSLSFFTNPRLKWLDGWVPMEDAKWVEFSRSF